MNGTVCVFQSAWYAQCVPPLPSSTESSVSSTSPISTSSTSSPSYTSTYWSFSPSSFSFGHYLLTWRPSPIPDNVSFSVCFSGWTEFNEAVRECNSKQIKSEYVLLKQVYLLANWTTFKSRIKVLAK